MARNWQTRLARTITFIQNTNVPEVTAPAAPIVAALNTWRLANPVAAQALSNAMSQNGSNNRPATPLPRAYRRATILLDAIFAPNGRSPAQIATATNNLNGQHATWYQYALERARDAVYSRNAVAAVEMALLRTHPARFLRKWRLSVAGAANPGVTNYGVWMENGFYKLDPGPNGNGRPTQIPAHNIPAEAYGTVVNNLGAIPGTSCQSGASDLALTTQFTGCAFCFQIHQTELVATHLDPGAAVGGGRLAQNDPQRVTADLMRQALINNGAFQNGNGGTFRVFGKDLNAAYAYPHGRIIIVSVYRNNEWRVYAQIQDLNLPQWSVYRIDQGIKSPRP
jgi:hypothetical protein